VAASAIAGKIVHPADLEGAAGLAVSGGAWQNLDPSK
jgi:hypothetical protein